MSKHPEFSDTSETIPADVEEIEATLEPAAEETVCAYLVVCSGPDAGRRFDVRAPQVTIGSDARCDICIHDGLASARHAALFRSGKRSRICDLASAHGTHVNSRRVDDLELRSGDVIRVGGTTLQFVSEGAPDSLGGRPVVERAERALPVLFVPQQAHGPSQMIPWGYQVSPPEWAYPPPPPMPRRDEDVSFADTVAQLRRVIEFFWPYRGVIAGLAAVGCVVGVLSVLVSPPRAAAFFDVRLHSKASANPLAGQESAHVEFFRSAATTFRSTGLIHKTLAALGEKTPSAERLESVQQRLVFENTGSDPSSQTYTGSFRGDTDESSLAFLSKHVELYLDGEIEKTLKIIRAQVEFLQGQLSATERNLRETEEKLLAFKKENIDGLPDQARQYYDLLFELQKKESDLESERSRVQAEAWVDARRLKSEAPMVESRSLSTRPYQQAIVDVNRQLAEGRANGLAADHPDVKQLQTKLSELKRLAADAASGADSSEVEKSRNTIYDETSHRLGRLRASAAANHQERKRLKEDQARVQAIVDKLPKLEAEYADLTRSYEATKQLHTRIFDQLKTAQLQYELEKASAGARYEIITTPRLEYLSLAKAITKRALVLLLAGSLVGVLVVIILQARNLLRPRSSV